MFIRYVSHAGTAAGASLVSRLFLSMLVGAIPAAASADALPGRSAEATAASVSGVAERRRTAARQSGQAAPACVTLKRPKHTIRKCGCAPGAISSVASIDVAEMLRLLTGDHGCRTPISPRE